MITGSVLSEENKPKLYSASLIVQAIKKYNLKLRHEKHKDRPHSIDHIMEHLDEEVQELKDALSLGGSGTDILSEIADVSNCCDILAMAFLDENKTTILIDQDLIFKKGAS